MYQDFKSKAEAVGAEVYRFRNIDEGVDFIIDFLRKEGVSDKEGERAVWAPSELLNQIDRSRLEKVPGLYLQVTRELAAGSKAGISQMEWALADTGTLVQDASEISARLVSSLTEIHIALITTDRILSDMDNLLSRIDPLKSPYISMITGPSRTADIERVLTIGVHGPERVLILFIDNPAGGE